ncbi:MAG: hypothetical protein KKB20_30560, partial [Proteobacteria bacterium]|nr:hypothetical protein [Pseudomonadota bacterium]
DRFSTMAEMEGALIQTLATVDPASAVTYSPDRTPPSLLIAQTGLSQRRLSASTRLPLWALLTVAAVLGVGVSLWAANPWSGADQQVVAAPADLGAAAATPDLGGVAVYPDARAAPVARTVKIHITSKPAKATVLDADGKVLGMTPLDHELPAGIQEVQLTLKRRGCKATIFKFVPDGDQRHEVTLKRRYASGIPDDPKGWGQR